MPGEANSDRVDANKSGQYILSIRLATDGFYFAVYNPIRNSLVLTRQREVEPELSITANMRKALEELDFLSYTYKRIDVMPVGKRFTLMPAELFAEDQAEAFFYYNFSPQENEIVLHDTLPKNGAVLLYALDKSLHDLLCEQYPQIRFQSSVSSLAEYLAVKSRLGAEKKMCAYVRRSFIEVYVYDRGHLMLLNAFECENNSDRAYYLLYVWKKLVMDQQTDELCLMGDGAEKDLLAEEMRYFIRHVSVLHPVFEFNDL